MRLLTLIVSLLSTIFAQGGIQDEFEVIEKQFSINYRPIIGVLTQPVPWKNILNPEIYSYIASSYIKYLEASGARVVPLMWSQDVNSLKEQMNNLNGLFFAGGGTDLIYDPNKKTNKQEKEKEKDEKNSETTNNYLDPNVEFEFTQYQKTAHALIKYAIELNDNGQHYPVWGTCLGFEVLVLAIAETPKVMTNFLSNNHSMQLFFNEHANKSRLLAQTSDRMKFYTQKYKTSYFNHMLGFSTENFEKNKNLSEFFDVLSFNFDKQNKEFVSTIESKHYPIWGVQYHPEKNPYELKDHLDVSHSPGAIEVSHFFSNFFVGEARKNMNRFKSPIKEAKSLINNYYPIMYSENFCSVYIFNSSVKPNADFLRANIRTKKLQANPKKVEKLPINPITDPSIQNLENLISILA